MLPILSAAWYKKPDEKHRETLESLFPHDTKSFDMLLKVRKAATYLKDGPIKITEELDVNATEKAREKAVDKSIVTWCTP